MDFLLPDDEVMALMRQEFDNLHIENRAHAFAASAAAMCDDCALPLVDASVAGNAICRLSEDDALSPVCVGDVPKTLFSGSSLSKFLLLYFMLHLGYNNVYEHQIFDSKRNLGRVSTLSTAFVRLNNIN